MHDSNPGSPAPGPSISRRTHKGRDPSGQVNKKGVGWAGHFSPSWGLLFGGCCCFKSGVCITLKTNPSCFLIHSIPFPLLGGLIPLLLFHGSPPPKSPPEFLPSLSGGHPDQALTTHILSGLLVAGCDLGMEPHLPVGTKPLLPQLKCRGLADWLAGWLWGSMPQPRPP